MQKNAEIAHDFFPFFKVHKDGSIQRYVPIEKIPPSDDPNTGLKSKDVVISINPTVSARIFIPKIYNETTKLPMLVYFHGGGFSLRSAFDRLYHNYIASLVHKANVIAVSVEHRLAPEHPIPACYDDSFTALKWVASHVHGDGEEAWLNDHGDFGHVFIGGDSSGANICYNLAVRIGLCGLDGVKLEGMILVHPFFRGTNLDRAWLHMCPKNGGVDDPRINPTAEDLGRIGFERIMIFVAGKDPLRDAGIAFYKMLKNNNGWKGKEELVVNEGEGHVFHLFKPKCEQALFIMKEITSFINNRPTVNLICRI